LALLLWVLFLAQPAGAAPRGSAPGPCSAPLRQALSVIQPSKISEETEQALRKAVSKFRERVTQQDDRGLLERFKNLKVNGKTLRPIQILGEGREGYVFLVKVGRKYKTVKIFDSLETLRNSLEGYKEEIEEGSLTPRIEEVDRAHRVILMEYVEGLPIDELEKIANPYSRFAFPDETYGLTRVQAVEVLDHIKQAGGFRGDSRNAVFDIKRKKPVVVDPW
jgi:hypothetical protein